MERTTWTDERLDDLAREMRAGFDRVDVDIRDLRHSMESRFTAIDSRFATIDARFAAVDSRFDLIDRRFTALENRLAWFGGGLMLTMLASILTNLL